MPVELFLTAITFVVALIGIFWRDPPIRAKTSLVILAVLASAGSMYKSFKDEADKKFMKTALISSLVPSLTSYAKLIDNIRENARTNGFEEKTDCYHNSDG